MHPDSFQTPNISLYFGDNLKFLNVKWDIFCLFQVHRQRKVSSPESGSTVGLRRVTKRLLNDDHHSHSSGSPMTRGSKVTSALVLIPKNCKTVYSSFLVLSLQVRKTSVGVCLLRCQPDIHQDPGPIYSIVIRTLIRIHGFLQVSGNVSHQFTVTPCSRKFWKIL